MKSILLFLCLIVFSYCTKMTDVSSRYRESLPTTTSEDKYFYLDNRYFFSHSNFIYIYLEDNNFDLSYNNIKYCLTNTHPWDNTDSVVDNCSFTYINYYSNSSSSEKNEYYYKIPTNSSYNYSIVYYDGRYSSGTLYIYCDYYYFDSKFRITPLSINKRTSLPKEYSINTYFYLINSNYYSHSSYIYICLEDNNSFLKNDKIKYCCTSNDPTINSDSVINGCSFTEINYYYSSQSSSKINKYYYKIPTNSSYTYSIVYYKATNSLGYLYATSDYIDLYKTFEMIRISRNELKKLSTSPWSYKFLYLINSDYYSYSNFIYICFEDYGFNLSYDNIKYCHTSNDPISNTDSVVRNCSFITINYYNNQSSSSRTKYYYKFPTTSSYNYSIIYYDGSGSSGRLFATIDYNELVKSVKMTQVARNYRTSLIASISYHKYFYLKNSDYYSYSEYIYIYFEDNNFDLSYNKIKYCLTSNDPSSNPDSIVNECSFTTIMNYDSKRSSDKHKYYYMISTTSSYTYSIVYYDGNNPSGQLYVTSDINDLAKTAIATYIPNNSKTSLPIANSIGKYFYVLNINYYIYSNYLYFNLEDDGFGLSYDKIKYCYTNTNPKSDLNDAVKYCSFDSITYYDLTYSSSSKIYHYKIPSTSYFAYSIVYYDGSNPSGYLYVRCHYESISSEDNALSAGSIFGIVIGSIAFIVICIIILYYFFFRFRKNKNDFGPTTQSNYSAYSSNQPNTALPVNNPTIPLQTVPMRNEAN